MTKSPVLEEVKKALAARFREHGFTGRYARFQLRLDDEIHALVRFRLYPTITSGPLRPSFFVETGVFRTGDEQALGWEFRSRLIRLRSPASMPWGDRFEFAEDLVSDDAISRFARNTVDSVLEQGHLLWPHLRSWLPETFEHQAVMPHRKGLSWREALNLKILEQAWADGTAAKPRDDVMRSLYYGRRFQRRLVDEVVLPQHNRFIKELLRPKGLGGGSNKEALRQLLYSAVDLDLFDPEDFYYWTRRVEGWGSQHVYVFQLDKAIEQQLDHDLVHRKVREAGISYPWNHPGLDEFPSERRLVSISFVDEVFEMMWFQPSTLHDDHRIVTRFQADLTRGKAAIFIPAELDRKEHLEEVAQVRETVGKVLDLSLLDAGRLGDAIHLRRRMDRDEVWAAILES